MKKVRSKLHPTEIGAIKTFSLSPNDEIGEIAVECSGCTYYYNNLAELCEKWEDVPEEPKEQYYIKENGVIGTFGAIEDDIPDERLSEMKQIGNYFETEEETEKAVEKLEAMTRLKSCGFKFKGWRTVDLGADKYYFVITAESNGAGKGDLDLLFGGEE